MRSKRPKFKIQFFLDVVLHLTPQNAYFLVKNKCSTSIVTQSNQRRIFFFRIPVIPHLYHPPPSYVNNYIYKPEVIGQTYCCKNYELQSPTCFTQFASTPRIGCKINEIINRQLALPPKIHLNPLTYLVWSHLIK